MGRKSPRWTDGSVKFNFLNTRTIYLKLHSKSYYHYMLKMTLYLFEIASNQIAEKNQIDITETKEYDL